MMLGVVLGMPLKFLMCLMTREHTSKFLRVGLPLVYVKDVHASTGCIFFYPENMAELEQQLKDCEDGLDHCHEFEIVL